MSYDFRMPRAAAPKRTNAMRYSGQLVCDITASLEDVDSHGSPLYTVVITGKRGGNFGTYPVRLTAKIISRASIQDFASAKAFDNAAERALVVASSEDPDVQEFMGVSARAKAYFKRTGDSRGAHPGHLPATSLTGKLSPLVAASSQPWLLLGLTGPLSTVPLYR